jgi:hypothetical protein
VLHVYWSFGSPVQSHGFSCLFFNEAMSADRTVVQGDGNNIFHPLAKHGKK